MLNVIQGLEKKWTNPKVIYRSLNRHMDRDLQILPKTRLPLTIFPIDSEIGLKLIFGELTAITLLNVNIVLQKFRDAGLKVSKDSDGEDIIDLGSDTKFSIVDGWEKILLELITIPSFVEYIFQSTQKINQLPGLQ